MINKGITDPGSLARLEYWKKIVQQDDNAWAPERDKMDWREALFSGTKTMKPTCKAEEALAKKNTLKCYHVRNIVAENIESMVDSRVPKPKVTAMNKQDEGLARILEELLQNYVKGHHLKELNDMSERMGPIQGGAVYLAEWDDTIQTPDGPGDVRISLLHPKQMIPQAGIYTGIEDMDHICYKQAMTVGQVRRRWGVDVSELAEEDPSARGADELSTEIGLVTVWVLYYRNGEGGVGMLAWTGDVLLCDLEDYQARRIRRCRSCGAVAAYSRAPEPERRKELEIAGQLPKKERCLWCEGTEFVEEELEGEEIMPPGLTVMDTKGQEIELKPAKGWIEKDGSFRMEPGTVVPYYKPRLFPVVLQKNISKFGQLLGESDVDKMDDAQNLIKRLDRKITDRIIKAGTKIILPPEAKLEPDTEDQRAVYLTDPAKAQMVRTLEFTGDVSKPMEMVARAYEEARQATGITDSMQGRRDPTATSAKAKEFSAKKSEGRMESRRVMKEEAWGRLFELIAKLYISCADEKRRVRVERPTGEVEYTAFDRKQFLKYGEKGETYYEDGFIFGCDNATSIGDSRESMWQEINSSFAAGTLGSPQEISTLILYWGMMEEQGYPGAASIKKKLEERQEQQMAAAQQPTGNPTDQTGGIPKGPAAGVQTAGGTPGVM